MQVEPPGETMHGCVWVCGGHYEAGKEALLWYSGGVIVVRVAN